MAKAKGKAKGKSKGSSRSKGKKGNVLTAKKRKALSSSSFALPGRRYPIPDEAHARNALARVAQHGSPAEKRQVQAAVRRKFPSIAVGGKKKGK